MVTMNMAAPKAPRFTDGSRQMWCLGLIAAMLAGAAARGNAQPASPRIGYVYPAGGQQGKEFQVSVGGQFLDGVTNVYLSGGGGSGVVLEHTKPLTKQQFDALREKLSELQEKRASARKSGGAIDKGGGNSALTNLTWTAQEDALVEELRRKLASFQRRPANPAIAETVTLRFKLNSDAEPGLRELRLGTPTGLSNPVRFIVGQLLELAEIDARAPEADRNRGKQRNSGQQTAVPAHEMRVNTPATLNGQIMPGGVDRYRFKARKGEQFVAVASARELVPYLPDAVPGWFQAVLTLYDSKGRELAYQDDFRFNPDPVLHCEIPADGEYLLEVRDAIYRGREDFVYRISIGEIPFVTSLFPLGGRTGANAIIELRGWNIPPTLRQAEIGTGPGLHFACVTNDMLRSNRRPFIIDALPERLENEPNDSLKTGELVTLPVIVNGVIGRPGDIDVFRFSGRAGDQIVAEVTARRLGSPLDSVVKLYGPVGELAARNDDHEDKGAGLLTHHADSLVQVALPKDGSYCLVLADAQRQGGPEHGYRLRISQPQPDFELRVSPSSLNLRPGICAPLTVYALRKDGYIGDVSISLKDAPPGFRLSGGRIPSRQDSICMTLSPPVQGPHEPARLSLEGKAVVSGQEVSRPVLPAEDMMQAFSYHHLVPVEELRVAVVGRGIYRGEVKLISASPARIPVGGTARVRLTAPPGLLSGRLQLQVREGHEGISIKEIVPERNGVELILASDPEKVKAGCEGNLIVNLVRGGDGPEQRKKKAAARGAIIGVLPAIAFEIVER